MCTDQDFKLLAFSFNILKKKKVLLNQLLNVLTRYILHN